MRAYIVANHSHALPCRIKEVENDIQKGRGSKPLYVRDVQTPIDVEEKSLRRYIVIDLKPAWLIPLAVGEGSGN